MPTPNDETTAKPESTPVAESTDSKTQSLADEYDIGDDGETSTVEQIADPVQFESQKPIHSKIQLKAAADFGLSEEETNEMSPGELSRFIAIAARNEKKENSQRARDEQGRFLPAGAQLPAQEPAPAVNQLDGLEDEIPAENYPKFHGILKAMAARIAQLENHVAGLGQREAIRENETRVQKIDRMFNELNAEALFGKGTRDELSEDNPEAMDRRVAVLDMVGRMKEGTFEQKFKKACKTLYPSVSAAIPPSPNSTQTAPKQTTKTGRFTEDQWNAAGLPRPTQRSGAPEPKGVSKAEKSVAKMLSDNGIASNGAVDTTMEEFLD